MSSVTSSSKSGSSSVATMCQKKWVKSKDPPTFWLVSVEDSAKHVCELHNQGQVDMRLEPMELTNDVT